VALTTKFGLPPDETYHYDFIRFFTASGWSPFVATQEGFYALGEAVKTPFFIYHYVLSLPNHFIGEGDFAILFLRMINVLMGVLSLFIIYKLAKYVMAKDFTANLVVFLIANTLMFVFISGSISYDNLFILISLFSVWTLLKLIKKPALLELLLLTAALLTGLLIKKNFIVVAAIIIFVLLVQLIKDNRAITFLRKLNFSLLKSKPVFIVLSLAIVSLFVLFAQRYVTNVISYGNFEPACTEVLSPEQCRQNGVFARNEVLDNMQRPPATKAGYEYVFDWSLLMTERVFGVFAHTSFAPYSFILVLIQTSLIAGVIAAIRSFSFRNKKINLILLISLAYMLVLIIENYMRYERYGSFTFAVQGRYAFPFIMLLLIPAVYYAQKSIRRQRAFYVSAALVAIVFFISSLPSYILLTDSDWQNQPAIEAKTRVVEFIGFD
jgi:hypothetical protein